MTAPLIIGHRGASAVAPENTVAAFEAAIAAGADGVEFDVRLTQDGVPVVIHDETLQRTGGLRRRVADLTVSELVRIDVGSWFAPLQKLTFGRFADQRVPTLQQLFELFNSNNLILYLEMKCQRFEEVRLAEACCKLLDEHSLKERVIVECFALSALEIVKSIDSTIKTAALFEPTLSTPPLISQQRIVDQAIAIRASEVALHHKLASKQLVRKVKLAGLKVVIWTVDDTAWIERAQSMSIDSLITNDPAAMIASRNEMRAV